MSPVSDSAVQFNFTAYGYKDKNEISYKMCISISQKFKKIGVESNRVLMILLLFSYLVHKIQFELEFGFDSYLRIEFEFFTFRSIERYIPGGL